MTRERGAAPIEFALGLLVIVVPVTLVVLLVAPVFEARNFVRRAAAESARAGVVSPTDQVVAANNTVEELALRLGVGLDQLTVTFCEGTPCSWERGAVFTVEISMPVSQVSDLLPVAGLTVSARHSEQVDLYRSRP
jgi:hypothetical protein